jgi:hypothetical protein
MWLIGTKRNNLKNVSNKIIVTKTRFVSMSVTSVFLHVISKVSTAIVKMDIYRNVRKKVANGDG